MTTDPIHLITTLEKSTDFHTCIILSYGADLAFYEELVLRTLWVRNCRYHVVFIDAQRYRDLTKQQPEGANLIGRHYVVVPVDLGYLQAFHSKLVLLLGDNGGLLLIGSGNLTFSGFGANLEVYTAINYNKDESGTLSLFQNVWDLILSLQKNFGHSAQVDQILSNASNRFIWLHGPKVPSEETWLMHSLEQSLLDQICQNLSGDTIRKVTIISPFFDGEGHAIHEIYQRLKPDQIDLIVQDQKTVANPASIERLRSTGVPLELFLTQNNEQRYLHAKIFLLEGDRYQWVITGSANCTSAALLRSARQGNLETILMRRGGNGVSFTYLLDTLNISPLHFSPDQINWRPPSEEPSIRKQQIHLLDATQRERSITLHFRYSELLASDLSLQAVIAGTYQIPFNPLPGQENLSVELPDEIYDQVLGKPILVFINAKDGLGHNIDLGCNALWINHSDELNAIRRGLPLLDSKAASYLADGLFTSESEWNELRQSLARLIEIETSYIQKHGHQSVRPANRTRSSDQASDESTETEVVITDESMVDGAGSEDENTQMVYQETLDAYFEHLRSRLPGRQKGSLAAGLSKNIATQSSNSPTPPHPSTARQFQNLIRKYSDSLRNPDYTQNVPIEHVPQYYFLLSRVVWFLHNHQGISKETFLHLLQHMTSGLLGSGDEKAPALEARSQRLIKRSLQKEWSIDFAPLYALANAAITEELSLHERENGLVELIIKDSVHILASIFVVYGLPDFDSVEVLSALLEIEEMMGSSENNILERMGRFIRDHFEKVIDLLARWKQETLLARKDLDDPNQVAHLEHAYLDYCMTRYDALKRNEGTEQLIEEASDGLFWSEKLGLTDATNYFRNELINLFSINGDLALLARTYYESGRLADLEGKKDNAIRYLQQAQILAEQIGLKSIIMKCQVRLKSYLSEK